MCEIMDKLMEKSKKLGVEQGIEQERKLLIGNLMSRMNLTMEEAMDALCIPEEERICYICEVE